MSTRWLLTTGFLFGLADFAATAQERHEAPHGSAVSVNVSRESANKIERALGLPFGGNFVDVSIGNILDKIEETHRIQIWIDHRSLTDDGMSTDQIVTLKLKSVTLRDALRLLLEPFNLTYVIHCGVLKIMTQEKADGLMFTRVYPLRDLLMPDQNAQQQYMQLMRTIQQSTPGKWEDQDGEGGRLSPIQFANSLVIRQTQSAHREIEGLLTTIREVKQLERIPSIAADPSDVSILSIDNAESRRSGSRHRSSRPAEE